MERYINTPINQETAESIQAGDFIYITGTIYSARDAAHQRMYEALQRGEELPFKIQNQVIYYLGPTPARDGQIIGSAGPTTSSRMDKYTPALLERGLRGMIGKGRRNDQVKESIRSNKAVYFAAIGGAGALLSKSIKSAKVIAYEDLGTEAVRELYVENFPVIAVIDSKGNDQYENMK